MSHQGLLIKTRPEAVNKIAKMKVKHEDNLIPIDNHF